MIGTVPARIWTVWGVLVAATACTWWLGADHALASSAVRLGAAFALALAFLKAYLIGLYFMDLRVAPPLLRHAFGIWTIVVGGGLVALVLV